MKPQIALSIEQMKELQSLGLDCSDASMAWINLGNAYNSMLVLATQTNEIMQWYDGSAYLSPAYTLEDILMKTPNRIEDDTCISVVFTAPLDETDYVSRMQQAFEAFKWVLQNRPDKIQKL